MFAKVEADADVGWEMRVCMALYINTSIFLLPSRPKMSCDMRTAQECKIVAFPVNQHVCITDILAASAMYTSIT